MIFWSERCQRQGRGLFLCRKFFTEFWHSEQLRDLLNWSISNTFNPCRRCADLSPTASVERWNLALRILVLPTTNIGFRPMYSPEFFPVWYILFVRQSQCAFSTSGTHVSVEEAKYIKSYSSLFDTMAEPVRWNASDIEMRKMKFSFFQLGRISRTKFRSLDEAEIFLSTKMATTDRGRVS